MTYLARYAHLKTKPPHQKGERIVRGTIIGEMGNTGQSTGAHLHFDLVQKIVNGVYRLSEIPDLIIDLPALMQQYKHFLDKEMWGNHQFRITTYFGDPNYTDTWKFHPAYDLVGSAPRIQWNRSKTGTVHAVGYDRGYGNYIVIKYEGGTE